MYKIDKKILKPAYKNYREHAVESKCSFIMMDVTKNKIMGAIWAVTLRGQFLEVNDDTKQIHKNWKAFEEITDDFFYEFEKTLRIKDLFEKGIVFDIVISPEY